VARIEPRGHTLWPKPMTHALVIHDGTREAEDLGRWWGTCFGASVATWQVPALGAPCTGLDSDWVARIRDVGADLVVLARDRRGGLRDPGGLSEYLLEQLDLPVLACRADAVCPRELHTILAPVDAGDDSSDALPLLLTLASAARAEVVWLQVVESPTAGVPGYADSDPEWCAFGRALQQLERLKLSLQRSGVASRACIRAGSVVASVASVAKHSNVDLLAMSTHARTGTARTIHGSTAGAIARMVAQPILWVHRR
jgi:nucleotide-binding universal stress UspA family protein